MPDVLDDPQQKTQTIDDFLGANPKIDDFLGPEPGQPAAPASPAAANIPEKPYFEPAPRPLVSAQPDSRLALLDEKTRAEHEQIAKAEIPGSLEYYQAHPVKLYAKAFGQVGQAIAAIPPDIENAIVEGTPVRGGPNVSAALEGKKPEYIERAELPGVPWGLGLAQKATTATISTVPKLAAVAGAQAAGVPAPLAAAAIFGFDEEGNFSPKAAAIAAALPIVGKWGGAITEGVASRLGMTSEAAKGLVNAGGRYATANAFLVAQELPHWNEMDDKQKQDAIAGILANGFLGLADFHGSTTPRGPGGGGPPKVDLTKASEQFREAAEKASQGIAPIEAKIAARQPTTTEVPSASGEQATTTVHGDLRAQPGQGSRQVPVEEGGPRIQPQAPGGIPEAPAPTGAPSAPVRPAEAVASLKPAQDVADHPIDQKWNKGGSTEALKFGASMDPSRPQDLDALIKLRDKAREEHAAIPDDEANVNRKNIADAKAHWLDEAIEGATGFTSNIGRDLLGKDYKPPFPKEKPVTGLSDAESARLKELRALPSDKLTPDQQDELYALATKEENATESLPSAGPVTFDPATVPTVETPVANIKLSKDVPNFKAGADPETGIVPGQELKGPYRRLGSAPIIVWRRLNGDLEVITGRHRLDLARRSGEKTIPTQIVDEAQGYTKKMALIEDAEGNIRDNQGTTEDYAHYFNQRPDLTEEAAGQRGLLRNAAGRVGFDIGRKGTDDLQALWKAGKVSDAQAVAIARAAPENASAQQIGIRAALEGEKPESIRSRMEVAQNAAKGAGKASQSDFFANTSLDEVWKKQGAFVAGKRKELNDIISTRKAVVNKYKAATGTGSITATLEAAKAELAQAQAELARWDKWADHPDLKAQVENLGKPPEQAAAPVEPKPELKLDEPESVEQQNARIEQERKAAEAKAAEEAAAADARAKAGGRTGGDLGSAGQGGLFEEPGQGEMFKPPAPKPPEPPNVGPGMGGAKPEEFAPSGGTQTDITNATNERQRAKLGLPPIIEPIRRAFGRVWDEAMALIDRDPGAKDVLIAELRDKPRAVTDLEDALLLHQQVSLQTEYAKTSQELKLAFDEGRTEVAESLKIKMEELRNQLFELYEINKKVGTETGRGLAARKMLAKEDFTLAQMVIEKMAANEGRQLTDAEHAEIARLHDRIAELQTKLSESETRTDQREVEFEIQRQLAEARAAAAAEPKYHPKVIEKAEQIVSGFKTRADAARVRLREKLKNVSAGVDPSILKDVAEIGAEYIARGTLDSAKWAAKMVANMGEAIRPFLEEGFEAAKARFNEMMKDAPEPVRRAIRAKGTAAERQAATVERIRQKVDEGKQAEIAIDVQKLSRSLVEEGITDREQLIDAVHAKLQEVMPDITRREAMDAISGYGKFKQLSKDAISTTLRDLKGQMREIGKLLDFFQGQAPKASGPERHIPSGIQRQLIKIVNEAKKRFGIETIDPAKQLKSTLDSIKTRLNNQIEDLQRQIDSKTKLVNERAPTPSDAETVALKAKRDALKKEFDDLFGKPELTEEQRVTRALASLDRQSAEIERQIKEGDVFPGERKSKTPNTAEVEAAKAKRDALKAEREYLRESIQPTTRLTPDERSLKSLQTRLTNRIAELKKKISDGDFSKKERKPPPSNPETNRLSFQLSEVIREYNENLLKDKLARRNVAQKIFGGVGETLNASRAVVTSGDLSAVLRQGGFIGLGHPIRSAKVIPDMLKAMMSPEQKHRVMQEIANRPNAPLYKRSGLYLSDNVGKLSNMEEAYMSRWAQKIPGVAASERAYTTFLNKLRADSFDAMAKGLSRTGTPTEVEAKAIANYINKATGRGSFGGSDTSNVILNTTLFSPRYLASRFQLLAGQPLYGGTARTRGMIAGEYARFLGGIAVIYALGIAAGGKVEDDPRSSDFGKLQFGNTRLDPLTGLSQITVLGSRLVSGQTKNQHGRVTQIRDSGRKKVPFGGSTTGDVLLRFGRSKLSPWAGFAADMISQKDMMNKPVNAKDEAQRLLVPIAFQDVYEAMKEQGFPGGVAIGLAALLGMGVQNYDDKKR